VLKGKNADRLAFITYYKGEYRLYAKDLNEPLKEVEQEVRSADEGSVDFQPDVPHQVVPRTSGARGSSRACSSRAGRRSTSASLRAATSSADPRWP
jgi:hypothetical protein